MNPKEKYRGVVTPMVSPLHEDGEIDRQGVHKIVERLLSNQCAPFVVGTTGEAASLPDRQKAELVEYVVEATAGAAVVYAGISGNCLQDSLDKARLYGELGVDVAVAHLPCYYPIDEEQMKTWFTALADRSPLPVMLYNIPVTTKLSLTAALVDELSRHGNIVGCKDSDKDADRLKESLALWRGREDFSLLSGYAAMSSFGLQRGLDGIVPSSSNLTPGLYRGIYDSIGEGNFAEADRLQAITNDISAYYQQDHPLSRSLPILKAMLAAFDLCKPCVASPMITLSRRELDIVRVDVRQRFGQYVAQS